MTAVFNMMVLGEKLKLVFTNAANNYVKSHPDILTDVQRPFEESIVCPLLDDDKSKAKYVIQFISTIVCKNHHLRTFQDVHRPGSIKYFYAKRHGKPNKEIGRGGWPLSVFINYYLF
jgi:hypothetical protein